MEHFVDDVLGVGFGPANIALAVAAEELLPHRSMRFLEARPALEWQPGMLIDRSNIQNHPVRDLVTPRNPRSRYSFVNFLFEQNRLLEHLNLGVEFPLRKEYAEYVGWVGGHFRDQVDYGQRAVAISIRHSKGERPSVTVRTNAGRTYQAWALVLAPGRTPFVPAPFDQVSSPRIFHFTEYLPRILSQPPAGRFAVIGGSQSAVELALDLSTRYPDATVINFVRDFGYRLKDTSPFSEESIHPSFTKYYFNASYASKRELDAYLRHTNYSAADMDVIKELYLRIYEQRLDRAQKVFVKTNFLVIAARDDGREVELQTVERHTGAREMACFDVVVLATGFRNLGPGPQDELYPPLLEEVVASYRFNQEGFLHVNSDYSLSPAQSGEVLPPLYLNGLCEASHGIGDAGSFSLVSIRAEVILRSLERLLLARPVSRPALELKTRAG